MLIPIFVRHEPDERELGKVLAREGKLSFSGMLDLLDEKISHYNSPAAQAAASQVFRLDDINRTVKKLYYALSNIHEYGYPPSLIEYLRRLRGYISEHIQQFDNASDGPHTALSQLVTLVFNCQDSAHFLDELGKNSSLNANFPVRSSQHGNVCLYDRHLNHRYIILFRHDEFVADNWINESTLLLPDRSVSDETIREILSKSRIKRVYLSEKECLNNHLSAFNAIEGYLLHCEKLITEYCQQNNLHDFVFQSSLYSQIKERLLHLEHFYDSPGPLLTRADFRQCTNYIKLLRNNVIELYQLADRRDSPFPLRLQHQIQRIKDRIRMSLQLLLNTMELKISLDESIRFCIAQVKSSATLYLTMNNQPKSEEMAFGEQNIAGIIAAMLRGMYYRDAPAISITSEHPMGLGRTDVTIKIANTIVGQIEFKLVRKGENIADSTANALHQIYARYSENDGIGNRQNQALYIVIFAHDKRFERFADQIYQKVEHYAAIENLQFLPHPDTKTENSFTFTLIQSQSRFGLADKSRTITVIIVNLEINHQKRTAEIKRLTRKSHP